MVDLKIIHQMYQVAFASHVRDKITELAKTYCYGCKVDHPSQTQHSCLMIPEINHFSAHFDEAFNEAIEKDIDRVWMDHVFLSQGIPMDLKCTFLNGLHDRDLLPRKDKILNIVAKMIQFDTSVNMCK